MKRLHLPEKQGLYDPQFEHDNCGVGFVCNMNGKKSNDIILKSLDILENMSHRGAVGADPKTLHAALKIFYSRITLMHKELCEKITIDFNLKFNNGVNDADLFLAISP